MSLTYILHTYIIPSGKQAYHHIQPDQQVKFAMGIPLNRPRHLPQRLHIQCHHLEHFAFFDVNYLNHKMFYIYRFSHILRKKINSESGYFTVTRVCIHLNFINVYFILIFPTMFGRIEMNNLRSYNLFE